MDKFQIPSETTIAYARLKVADLERSADFYVDKVGFKPNVKNGDTLGLSATGLPPYCIYLTEIEYAEPKPPRTTGLYHAAVRFPSRIGLANSLKRLLSFEWSFRGAADHGVSEALYLVDPDGNGLEFYADRPKSQWQRSNGHIRMGTDALDLNDLLNASNDGARPALPEGTNMGHVHLQVADLGQARHFYHDILGLDVTQEDYPGALFLSAGGYHHHIGLNTWAGKDAPPPPPQAVGLGSFGLRIPNGNAFQAVRKRLDSAGVAAEEVRENGIFKSLKVLDPSGNQVDLVM
jgi:catechol 2,3-dioxygenase